MKEILKSVEATLKILGYDIKKEEQDTIVFLIQKHNSKIIYECAIEKIFGPLVYVVSDKVCAEFLKSKIVLGEDIGISIGSNAKDIKIGDISVSFPENSTNEEKINLILSKLEREDFNYAPYRKLRW